MTRLSLTDDNNIDDSVDEIIGSCLSLEMPISFFLFAGAGSGKTRSLVKALEGFLEKNSRLLRLRGQQVAVITYTNAACEEIKHRLNFNPLIHVSTIHSFIWSLIGEFHKDIRQWLRKNLEDEIENLEAQQRKGRASSKAALDRAKSIESKSNRLTNLDSIKRFVYNPHTDNKGRDSLNHSEVIKIGADFITEKPLMQNILISKFPILLIDESQDTNKHFMDSLLLLQERKKEYFCLGLFGDTMQRIYSDGKLDLGHKLPSDWAKPAKQMNHRCPKRVVKLINDIRSTIDGQQQRARNDKEEGIVRLFILSGDIQDKPEAELKIAAQMASITSDSLWSGPDAQIKTLILEHHMAAKRLGFLEMFEPLYRHKKLRTSLLDGSLSGLRIFSKLILPLVKAKRRGDNYTIAAIIRKNSPLIAKSTLKSAGEEQQIQIKKANEAVKALLNLWANSNEPRFLDALHSVAQTKLFEIPESLRPIVARNMAEQESVELQMAESSLFDDEDKDDTLNAWDEFLLTPFSQIEPYTTYINGEASFDTHQGVKGLEFPRVMVIIDDEDARGFLFSYEKLFGVKEKTSTDLENEQIGKDTSIDGTRRLFYVTCSRAEKSLALVAYSQNPEKVRDYIIQEGWFESGEVIILK